MCPLPGDFVGFVNLGVIVALCEDVFFLLNFKNFLVIVMCIDFPV